MGTPTLAQRRRYTMEAFFGCLAVVYLASLEGSLLEIPGKLPLIVSPCPSPLRICFFCGIVCFEPKWVRSAR